MMLCQVLARGNQCFVWIRRGSKVQSDSGYALNTVVKITNAALRIIAVLKSSEI